MNSDDNFWPSYVDLLTSLFFIVLLLFAMSFVLFKKQEAELKASAAEAQRLKEIRQNLNVLLGDTVFFIPRPEYKRYELATDVEFVKAKEEFNEDDLLNYKSTVHDLRETGEKLMTIVSNLKVKKEKDENYKDVSYLMVIEGRASNLSPEKNKIKANFDFNYHLSYMRAFNLFQFWKEQGYDFSSENLQDIIDLQISGNGLGGVGRYSTEEEHRNQSFIIQILPKLGTLGE